MTYFKSRKSYKRSASRAGGRGLTVIAETARDEEQAIEVADHINQRTRRLNAEERERLKYERARMKVTLPKLKFMDGVEK